MKSNRIQLIKLIEFNLLLFRYFWQKVSWNTFFIEILFSSKTIQNINIYSTFFRYSKLAALDSIVQFVQGQLKMVDLVVDLDCVNAKYPHGGGGKVLHGCAAIGISIDC